MDSIPKEDSHDFDSYTIVIVRCSRKGERGCRFFFRASYQRFVCGKVITSGRTVLSIKDADEFDCCRSCHVDLVRGTVLVYKYYQHS